MLENVWNEETEKILQIQVNKCASYKWLHDEEQAILKIKRRRFTVFNIIFILLSTLLYPFTNSSGLFGNGIYIINIIYPSVLFISSLLNIISQFSNYSQIIEQHRTSSIRYTALYNNIKRMLALSYIQREEFQEYFGWATKEYDYIFICAPDISISTVKKFKDTFKIKPDIENVPIDTLSPTSLTSSLISKSGSQESIKQDHIVEIPSTKILKCELNRFMVNSFK